MTNLWDQWKRGFTAWEQQTATFTEKVLSNPGVLGPTAALLTAAMKTKAAADKAMGTWWSMWGLSTRADQERTLHKLNQLESRLMDLQEQRSKE